jgi:hypothetical protein
MAVLGHHVMRVPQLLQTAHCTAEIMRFGCFLSVVVLDAISYKVDKDAAINERESLTIMVKVTSWSWTNLTCASLARWSSVEPLRSLVAAITSAAAGVLIVAISALMPLTFEQPYPAPWLA